MWPGASVSGLYFGHPDAKYFGVGKIEKDQILDYQERKGMALEEVERWLGHTLPMTQFAQRWSVEPITNRR